MAIVKMSRISIVGLEDSKDGILRLLMRRGFMQIDNGEGLLEQEDFKDILQKDGCESEVIQAEQSMLSINQAIESLKRTAQIKSPAFMPRPDFKAMDLAGFEEQLATAERINALSRDIISEKNTRNALANSRDALMPWVKLDIPLDQMETRVTAAVLGTLPAGADINAVEAALNDMAPESVIGIVERDKQFCYIYLIAHKDSMDEAVEAIRESGFSPVVFSDETGTPSEAIAAYDDKISACDKKAENMAEEIKAMSGSLGGLQNAYDYCTAQRDKAQAVENIVKTKTSFCITGWLPADKTITLVKELTDDYGCYVETKETEKGEDFPVLLENNSVVTPFESITNMYSTPSPRDIDPSAIMSFFYIIFFGMMLADAGYGLLIALACLFIVKRGKMQKGEGNLIKLMGICGVSTTIWGFIFGSFFGVGTPALINPLEDVMLLMAMSLVFGLIHIYIGLGIKGYTLLRDKDYMGFAGDVLAWYIFIAGVVLLVLPIVAGDIGALADAGVWLAVIGAVAIILTNGRQQRNPFMKLYKGVSALYGITGYFGDVLSYTRLMALCLSSGVIAQVVNLLGQMAGPIGIVLIGLAGHAVNLFIGALGAYVHTSRLQFVEFFGKFYEGGGIPFKPFKFKPKYTNMSKEEM